MCCITTLLSVMDWTIYVTVVPQNYNGAKKFPSPSHVIAIVVHYSHVRGDAGVNTPTLLPVI